MFQFDLNGLTLENRNQIQEKSLAMKELKENWAFKLFIEEMDKCRQRAVDDLINKENAEVRGEIKGYDTAKNIPDLFIKAEEDLNIQIAEEAKEDTRWSFKKYFGGIKG